MTMTTTQAIITIAAVVLGTMATRFIPFIIFPGRKKSTGVCQISGDGSSLCGDRSSCDLLSQGCAGEQYSRAAGSNCNFIYRIDP